MISIHLTAAQRQELLDHYRREADSEVRLRAHILLLLDAGHPWATVAAVLFCSTSTISRWQRRFEKDGADAVFGRPRGRKLSGIHVWATLVVRGVLTLSPVNFRFARSRWSCEAAAVVLWEDFQVQVGRETVRLWLRDAGLVWRRPRPTIRPKDPDREARLKALRALLKRHLDDLRRAFRHYKVIHVLCDNAGTHTADGSKLVRAYLEEWGHRVKLHYLPKYSPTRTRSSGCGGGCTRRLPGTTDARRWRNCWTSPSTGSPPAPTSGLVARCTPKRLETEDNFRLLREVSSSEVRLSQWVTKPRPTHT